jgi:helix-turn-helix resolvase-like protein
MYRAAGATQPDEAVAEVKALRSAGKTVPDIMREKGLSKSSVYRALSHAVGLSP